MKYFKVIAKCGHVGKNYYYEGTFYVTAESKKAAANKVRYIPRVKHHQKDAILQVEEVNVETFERGKRETYRNPYFTSKNKQTQELYNELILDNIHEEEGSRGNSTHKYKNKRHSLKRIYNYVTDYEIFKIKRNYTIITSVTRIY